MVFACSVFIGIGFSAVVFYENITRIEKRIDEVHITQKLNSERARLQRDQFESKIDSLLKILKHQEQ